MRRRYRWDRKSGALIEVTAARAESVAPYVQGDLPEYQSPITGQVIRGRRARRDDLKRHNCRPYEGFEQEKREADKVQAERERRTEQLAERMAHSGWAEMPPRVRKVLRGE